MILKLSTVSILWFRYRKNTSVSMTTVLSLPATSMGIFEIETVCRRPGILRKVYAFMSEPIIWKISALAHLSVECKDDKFCIQKDPNSHCLTINEFSQCACKQNYHLDLTNRTGKCVYGEPTEEYREGLTAAPIILCFMGCVVVEAVCLLAFHYWKKHRQTAFISNGTCHLQAISLADVQFHIQDRRSVISFNVTSEMDSSVSDARTSPPPYCQTVIAPSSNASQCEEPPPPYEEAIKQSFLVTENSSSDNDSRRKMSC